MTIKAFIPRPQYFTFLQWGALVAEALAAEGVKAPMDENDWQTWASSLLYSPDLAFVPDSHGFQTWQDWASRVAETF